jgi:TusA-related sulfurtransferase
LRIFVRPIGLAWSGLCLTWSGIRRRLAPWSRAGSQSSRVTLPNGEAIRIAESLDFIGDTCLRTNLLTKLVLERAAPGSIVEILSDNLSAIETIPFMLSNCRCVHVATIHEPNLQRIYVRKCITSPEFETATGDPRND